VLPVAKYYFDTSIWLDLLEDRNEWGLPKGEYAEKLLVKIISKNDRIVLSDIVAEELVKYGYTDYHLPDLLKALQKIILYEKAGEKHSRRALDLARRRNLSRLDALHALLAKETKAVVVSRDTHFKQLNDIARCKKPEELI